MLKVRFYLKYTKFFLEFKDVLLTSRKFSQVKDIHKSDDPTVQDLNALAQDKFLRPKGSERLDEIAKEHYRALCAHLSTEQKDKIINLFRALGEIDPVYPIQKSPRYILIQGSTVPNMRERIMFLQELVTQGQIDLRPDAQIIFLAGERVLFSTETPHVLTNTEPFPMRQGWEPPPKLPGDEREAAKMVWDQLDLTPRLRSKKPLFVEASKKQGAQRAQTEDCVRAWIENPLTKPGSCLIVSSNPYVNYQTRVTFMILKQLKQEGFILEGVGEGVPLMNILKILQ
jgi:hypothetical protein